MQKSQIITSAHGRVTAMMDYRPSLSTWSGSALCSFSLNEPKTDGGSS